MKDKIKMEFALNDTGVESLFNVINHHLSSKWEQQRYTVVVYLFAPSQLPACRGETTHILFATRKKKS